MALVSGHLCDTGKGHCPSLSSDQQCSSLRASLSCSERGPALNSKLSTEADICIQALPPQNTQWFFKGSHLKLRPAFVPSCQLLCEEGARDVRDCADSFRRSTEGRRGGWPLGAQGGRREASVVWDKDEDLTKWKDGVIREDPEWMKEHLRQM